MIVDGRQLATEILDKLKSDIESAGVAPKLFVLQVGDNPASEQFVALKTKKARQVGIETIVNKLPEQSTTEEIIEEIVHANHEDSVNGIVVQLPLSEQVDTDTVLDAVSSAKDVDALSAHHAASVLPPVMEAIVEIISRNNLDIKNKKVLVVGQGRLVGLPAAEWFESNGADVTAIDEHSISTQRLFAEADIIVSGAGTPHIIKPVMIKEGVVIFDAGTSEDSGKLVGDADPVCAEKAAIFTPVPGGIGPMTVALLLRNVVTLMDAQA